MSETSLKPVIEKLENLFSKFNEKFYNGELQTPIITVSPDTTKGAYGWCTAWKAWSNKQPEQKKTVDLAAMSKEDLENLKKDEGFYEINICAEHLARPFEQVAETLLHEMVHLYNLQIGVQDTSRGGTYHNKKYKEAAEQHGLTVDIFPNSMYVDAMGAASVFLLGGDNATIRLYILSIMFGVLYNFYHRKKYKIPVFAIFNLILFAFLRDIATAKLMAVIIVAFLLILEVKDIKFLTPTFSIIFNAFIFFTVVIMQSISNFYVNIFEALGRNATLTYRTTLWSISFKWILERPWFGYGYLDDDSFNFMVKERTTTGLFNTGNPHNTYLTLLLAGGIVLLAFFIFILIRTSRMSRECPILITNVLSGFLTTLMLHAQVEGRDQAFILLICCGIYYVSKIKDELPIINKKRLKLFE